MGARRADLADEVHGADIDAQLERRGCDAEAYPSFLEPPLRVVPALLGQAAVVGDDVLFSQALRHEVRDPFHEAPGVDEYQGGAMLSDQAGDTVQHVRPLLVGRYGGRSRRRAAALWQCPSPWRARYRPRRSGPFRRRQWSAFPPGTGQPRRWAAAWRTGRLGSQVHLRVRTAFPRRGSGGNPACCPLRHAARPGSGSWRPSGSGDRSRR